MENHNTGLTIITPEDVDVYATIEKRAPRERRLFELRDTDCDVDLTYAVEIARATELAKAEFADIWAQHGDAIVEEGKDSLYLMHVYGIVSDPLMHLLDGMDAFVSREVEGRDSFVGRFAGCVEAKSEKQHILEAGLRAALALLDADEETIAALRARAEAEDAEEAEEAEKDAGAERPKGKRWPTPEPLPNPLTPVAEFDIEFLPERLQPWVADTSYRMQCAVDFVGVSLINLLGSVIGRKMGIRLKQFDDWTEFANLWGILVARPGKKKTPAMDAVLSFQSKLIVQAKAAQEEALKAHRKESMKHELRQHALEAKAKMAARKAVASGEDFEIDDSMLDGEAPKPPSVRRYATNDATYEKLADLHAANPNGLMVHQDEMIALMKKLDNPDNADWRAFALTGWGGKSSHTVDRVGRGTQTIAHVCLSLLGATQPERMAAYVRPAITGTEDDDGLSPRFQMTVWPDSDKPWVYVDQWPDTDAKNQVWEIVKWLDAFDPEKDVGASLPHFGTTPFKQFDSVAQALWIDWSTKLHNRIGEGLLGRAMASHLSKYEKLVGALALIFHLVDCATAKTPAEREGPIGRAQLDRAIQFSTYLETHAERVYSSGAFGVTEAVKLIHGRIVKGSLKEGFSARDIYRAQWSGLTDHDLVNDAMELMVDLSWIRALPADNKHITRGVTYSINPGLAGLAVPPQGSS